MPEGEHQTCWLVFASETQTGLKTFLQGVHPLLLQLEAADEEFFFNQARATASRPRLQ